MFLSRVYLFLWVHVINYYGCTYKNLYKNTFIFKNNYGCTGTPFPHPSFAPGYYCNLKACFWFFENCAWMWILFLNTHKVVVAHALVNSSFFTLEDWVLFSLLPIKFSKSQSKLFLFLKKKQISQFYVIIVLCDYRQSLNHSFSLMLIFVAWFLIEALLKICWV